MFQKLKKQPNKPKAKQTQAKVFYSFQVDFITNIAFKYELR